MAETRKRLAISLAPETAKKLERLARDAGLTKSALLTVWINEHSREAADE